VEQANSASRVIVTCEEILSKSQIRNDPDRNSLPPFLIDAVVKAPIAAHPTACHYFYDYDPEHLRMYADMAKDDANFELYLKEWVYGIPDQTTYLEKVGLARLERIRADPSLGYAPGLDRR